MGKYNFCLGFEMGFEEFGMGLFELRGFDVLLRLREGFWGEI